MQTEITGQKKQRNAVYVRKHPRGKSPTSTRAIKLAERRAEVLNYRRQGHSYEQISKLMKIPTSSHYREPPRALRTRVFDA